MWVTLHIAHLIIKILRFIICISLISLWSKEYSIIDGEPGWGVYDGQDTDGNGVHEGDDLYPPPLPIETAVYSQKSFVESQYMSLPNPSPSS